MQLLCLLVTYCLFSMPLQAAVSLDESWVRVRLFENRKSLFVAGLRLEIVKQGDSFRNVSMVDPELMHIEIQWQNKWRHPVLVTKSGFGKTEMKTSSLFIKGENMRSGSESIGDFIQIYNRPSGFDVIAYVKLRNYLKGVVSSEMPVNWPRETLKAQIVAARSYVVYMTEKRKKLIFDVESSIRDQVYKHNDDPKLDPLLDETANMVLLDENRHLLKAYYHSECGGQTLSAKKVFGDTEFDAEVRDPYCAGRTWRLRLPKVEVEKYFGTFKSIVSRFNPMKRSYSLDVERPSHSIEAVNTQKIRMEIGSTRMKSTWFETKIKGASVEIIGKGYGHGVGLCQWGSRQMGVLNKSYKEILSFYYPKSIVRVVSGVQSVSLRN